MIVYETPGEYFVTLQVTNGNGTDVLMVHGLIQVALAPDATFEYTVMDDLVSLNYPGTDYDSLHWDFGDGRTDNSLNPTVKYEVDGQYEITLTVYNSCGVDMHSVIVDIMGTSTSDPVANTSGWQLRPTPFDNEFTIYGEPLNENMVTIVLSDMHGKIISIEDWTHKAGSATKVINSANLPAGIILVQIRDVNGIVVLKGVRQ